MDTRPERVPNKIVPVLRAIRREEHQLGDEDTEGWKPNRRSAAIGVWTISLSHHAVETQSTHEKAVRQLDFTDVGRARGSKL